MTKPHSHAWSAEKATSFLAPLADYYGQFNSGLFQPRFSRPIPMQNVKEQAPERRSQCTLPRFYGNASTNIRARLESIRGTGSSPWRQGMSRMQRRLLKPRFPRFASQAYHNGLQNIASKLTQHIMTKTGMNPKVDTFLINAKKWRQEFEKLRKIILDCRLAEEFKWCNPCYTFEGSNIVLIHGFKEYCALLFFKGALLKDAKHILIQQTENVQAARQIQFTHVGEITDLESVLKAYIREAIEVEKAGLKVHHKETSEFVIPEEFQKKLDAIPALKTAFNALTPGRQRGYIFHFSKPKQSKTRESKVEKCMKQILNGKGLNDE
jgi:uncharacterized protein YdeI (YjbR/CyaY-like superfamily)